MSTDQKLHPIRRSTCATPSVQFDFVEDGYLDYFGEGFWRLSDWSCSSTGVIQVELDFLQSLIADNGIRSVYDVVCGRDRHLVPLLNSGLTAVGMEIKPDSVEICRGNLIEHGHSPELVVCADAGNFVAPEPMGMAISMFSSFGYGTDEQNQEVLNNVRASLREGGIFVMDLPNREQLVRDFVVRSWTEVGGYHYMMHFNFDFETGYKDCWLRLFDPAGQMKTYFHRVRLYTTTELKRMLADADMELVSVLGDFESAVSNFDRESRRLQYVARAKMIDQDFLYAHVKAPVHGGAAHGNRGVSVLNPGCGDRQRMMVRMDGSQALLLFQAAGCSLSRAATLVLLEATEGMSREECLALTPDFLGEQMGKDLLMSRPQCVTLGLRAFKQICNETDFDRLAGESA
ncbi:iron-sulfur cluster assembly scaffold protein [Corynebacterium sp. CCM 9203]|uniref:iron-sulfur cluster assembly scaffold protein n=1 Tax=Corynebacterium sp. CCM 9203 TaxID=3057615 RepID=UPI0035263BDA